MTKAVLDALKVLILTPATVEFLEFSDPQALKQAREAVKAADGTDCECLARNYWMRVRLSMPMTETEKLVALRAAFATGLKYSSAYGKREYTPGQPTTFQDCWNLIFHGGKLPETITLDTNAGDIFAYWFNQYRIRGDYREVARQFFTRLD